MGKKKPNATAAKKASAAGERRALTGLLPQYRVAAALVLNAMRRRELEFIELTNDANAAVDDLVIATASRIDAYQIKWREYPESFTFNDLKKDAGKGRTQIGDLFEGHNVLSTRFQPRRVVVHLYTCDYPSNNDECRKAQSGPSLTFAKFLDQVWQPVQRGDKSAAARESATWESLRKAANAEDDKFMNFVADCELNFCAQLANNSDDSRDAVFGRVQERELAQFLMELAIDPSRSHHFTFNELLERLNWSHFFDFRNRHAFTLSDTYEQIDTTAAHLNTALDQLAGGYIFLGGTPGSGKSSLLTRTFELRNPKERWIRYYAFIPGSPEPANIRGESENFLHDITTALDKAGIIVGQSRSEFDRQQLISRLDAQLQRLGKEYKDDAIRTVILIDGLDHIPREQNPQISLLVDLPHPNRIPDGVFVLLGSQTDQLQEIPPAVKASVAEEQRRVLMEPLTPANVDRVISMSDLAFQVTPAQKKLVYKLSQGHPLAVSLIVNHLRDAANTSLADEILNATEPYEGDIDKIYFSYWHQLESDAEVVNLLALAARLRRHLDLAWLHTFLPHAAIGKLKKTLRHLFHRETESRWFFFHNSFRLFIRRNTSTLLAEPEAVNEKQIHLLLSEQCERSAPASPWSWETIFHLAEANEHNKVVQIATSNLFRSQLLDLRPLDAISNDIRRSLRSAGVIFDTTAIVRLVLIAAEFDQRSHGLSDTALASLLMKLGNFEVAIEHLFDGRELRISDAEALRNSRVLFGTGRQSEARRLFELTDPASASIKSEGADAVSAQELLEEWVRTASLFRNLDSIIAFIQGVTCEAGQFNHISAEAATTTVRGNLLFYLAVKLWEDGKLSDSENVERLLDTDDYRYHLWFWLRVRKWRAALEMGEAAIATELIQTTLNKVTEERLDAEQLVVVAEGLFRTLGQSPENISFIDRLTQPRAIVDYLGYENVLSAFSPRFRVNRLLRAMGRDTNLTVLIPPSTKFETEGLVFYERAVTRISFIWGDSWRGRQYSDADIKQNASDILKLFDRARRERLRWTSWDALHKSDHELFGLLIEAVAQHGADAVASLKTLFEVEWRNATNRSVWRTATRRNVSLKLYELGIEKSWVLAQLAAIEPSMLEGHDITGRIQECKEQSEAYLRLRETDKGKHWLKTMLSTSFGVGYRKDHQLDAWIEWLPLIGEVDAGGIGKRLAWFAAAAKQLEEATEGRSAVTAASKLIEIAGAWNARGVITLVRWFKDHGPISYASSLSTAIEAMIDSESISPEMAVAAISDLLFRFSTEPDGGLAEKLIRYANRLRGKDAAKRAGDALYHKICLYGLPSVRNGWAIGIRQGLAEAGISDGIPIPILATGKPKTMQPDLSTVKLDDGTSLQEEELIRKCDTVDNFLAIKAKAANSYYRWGKVVDKLAADASLSDVQRLSAAMASTSDEWGSIASLSKRATQLGNRELAWHLGLLSLSASREYGWVEWHDGGSRIAAFKALSLADPDRGKALCIQTFVSDMSKRSSGPSGVIQNLLAILPLFVDPLPISDLWTHVQDYLFTLCPDLETHSQPELHSLAPETLPDESISELVADDLCGPIKQLAVGAQHCFANLLANNHAGVMAAISKLLFSGRDATILPAISLLRSFANEDVTGIKPFQSMLEPLVDHPNLCIWFTARDLLKLIGAVSLAPRPLKEIPSVYRLHLPEDFSGQSSGLMQAPDGEPLPNPIAHFDMLVPFDSEIRWAARWLNRVPEPLLFRTVSLMKEIFAVDEWSSDAERKMRIRLSNAGLEFTFHRPRGQAARTAMFHAFSEVVDCGAIDYSNARLLYESLCPYDHSLMLLKPSLRPQEVTKIEGIDSHGHCKPEWVSHMRESEIRFTETVGDNLVIGEIMKLRGLGWELPTINICSGVSSEPCETIEEVWVQYQHVSADEYLSLEGGNLGTNLLILKNLDGRESDCSQWLALNPKVGRKLGWQLSSQGLFQWLDCNMQKMAETIWWKDGFLEHQPPKFEDEVGEGCLVCVTPKAMEHLLQLFPHLHRFTTNRRRLKTEEKVHDRSIKISTELFAK